MNDEVAMEAAPSPPAAPPKKRVYGRPFAPGPLPPADLLAEVRGKVEAGEYTMRKAAEVLGRTNTWMQNHCTKHEWAVPSRLRKQAREEARKMGLSKAATRRGEEPGDRQIARARNAVWKAIATLTKELDAKILEGAPSEDIAKLSATINKLIADARRNGEPDTTVNRNASGGAPPDTPEDMARLRSNLVASIARVLATYPPVESPGVPAGDVAAGV